MYRLLHKIFGAYTLSVPAEYGISLINMLNSCKILFWGAKKKGDIFIVKASLFSCEGILRTAAEMGIEAQIIKTVGIPFVFAKYKGRYGLILGSFIGLFLIFFSQLFIWEVTISGNHKIDEKVITAALEEYGIKRGAFIPKLDLIKAEELFLMENRDVSSLSVNLRGTYARVALLERTYPPDITDTSIYYNIVASHDGIIIRVEAVDGSPEVMAGDAVIQGQLLINAFMPSGPHTYRLTRARGRVFAEVKENVTISIPLEQTEKLYTGKSRSVSSVKVLGNFIPLLSSDTVPFEYYDVQVTQKEQKIVGILKTPVEITSAVYTEYRINRYTLSEDAARIRAEEAFAQLLARIEDEIVSHSFEGHLDAENNAYILTASVVVIKDIAIESPIRFTD